MQIYILRDPQGVELARSAAPITVDGASATSEGMAWLNLPPGCTVEEAAAGPVVPTVVTQRQARLALLGAGLLDAVDAAIDAIPDPATRAAARIT